MFRKTTILLVAALSFGVACKADDASTKPEATEVTETGSNGAATPETQPTEPEATDEVAEGTFGELVAGATAAKITKRAEDGSPGEERTVDAEWIAQFVAAVGPDQPGSGEVPRCVPQYTIAFHKGETELASFGAVCSEGSESVTLVHTGANGENAGYPAGDAAAAHQLLIGLYAQE